MEMFHCNKCGLDKVEEEFYLRTTYKYEDKRVRLPCKECQRSDRRIAMKEYGLRPEVRERDRLRSAERRKRNPEHERAKLAKFYAAHPDYYTNKYRRDWADPIKKARIKSATKKWVSEHPEIRAVCRANARTKTSKITRTEWLAILTKYNHRCAYCGDSGKLTLDHVTPICKSGLTTVYNCVPACVRCNRKKNRKDVESFLLELSASGIRVVFDKRFAQLGINVPMG